ncbi:hypothetical protein [uncultured Methylobacterium sp.]|uniref:hypothetical protein n=1 Tax=uncultured Methylobacterium sp. TaxID=157278 RepID=UPI0035CBAD92
MTILGLVEGLGQVLGQAPSGWALVGATALALAVREAGAPAPRPVRVRARR